MLPRLNTVTQNTYTYTKIDQFFPKIPQGVLNIAKGVGLAVSVVALYQLGTPSDNNTVNGVVLLVSSCFAGAIALLQGRKEHFETANALSNALANRAKLIYPELKEDDNEMILNILFAPATAKGPEGHITRVTPGLTFDYAIKMVKGSNSISWLVKDLMPVRPAAPAA